MEIQNASATSSKSNQLRNVNTVGWESWNVTTQPWEINNRKSEVIAFVVRNEICVRLFYRGNLISNATIITPRLMTLPLLQQWLLTDLHWFWGQNMTGKGQT